jgi:hypothetical protein
VRPLRAPWQRALVVLGVCLVLMPPILALAGLRHDYSVLGPWVIWSFTVLQLAAAYMLAALALRSVIPGRLMSTTVSAGLVCLAVAGQVLTSVLIFERSPVLVPPGQGLRLWAVCLAVTLVLGLLPAIAAFGLGLRGLPLRPRLFGLLCGLSAGLGAEAAWRLHCPFSDLAHIFSAHLGGIASLGLLGFLVGSLWERKSARS